MECNFFLLSSSFDRIIVNIIHNTSDYHPKVLRFLNVAFDGSGDGLIAGDHQGNIYVFDLYGNRFNLVQRTAQACTALAFNLHRKSEFLVALADYSIKCFDTVTKELVSWMRGHESSVSSISVHASGRYAITTSSETAQLWDLDTFQRKRKLNIRQSVGIQKVFFLPLSNTILSCFKDNSIFAWECDTLFCKYQLPAPPESSSITYKVFAVTRDGRILAAGGKSNHLHLWCLEATQLFRILQMPTKVRAIRHLEFLPDSFDAGSNQVLGVLSQDGIMRFVNIQTCTLVFEIGSLDEGISSAVISPHGRYIASVMENGSLNIYSVQALTQEINKNELSDGLNKKRLQILLKGYGEYPTKYRTLSALAHWSVIFSDTPYLPLLAFPFVKLFQNNQLICFEVVATLIINWCQHWFEYFPNPPINILSMIENVLAFHDKELLQHFIDHDITSQYFFHHRNNLDINTVIREVYRLMDTTPTDIHPESMLDAFVALTKGQYPVFNQYPKFIVDYQTQERERIRNDELDYLRERQTVEGMQAEVDQQRDEEEAWYQKQELLRKAEETRREMLLHEEEKMIRQRQKLAAVKRELKMKEIHLQDAARRRFLKLQQDQREMELRRLDDEIERKVYMRDQEIATTAKDLEMRQLELESQKRLYEKNLIRNQEAVAKEIREDADTHRRKVDLEEHMFHKLVETGQARSQKAQKVIAENLAKAEQACLNADWQIQTLHRQKCDDLQRNECYQEVAKLLRKNRRKEIELLNAMKEEEAKKWKEAEEKEFHLRSEKNASALSDASRKWFLKQELNAALEHAECPHNEEAPGIQNEQLASSSWPRASPLKAMAARNSAAHMSLNRKPTEWDTTEENLIKRVRNLRQRLTAQARNRCQTPGLLTT
ncbi:WD repeat-containing protein 67 [Tupaia chinensis]|uniref:WD repeat-containing protein 67 n=1 Tax=Tupaia chinensis TaxID=246437 RepID=L9JEQ3_TUPCH|nr:WD repeat-containing protein 67 [Tupaia chinensis]